jgi:mannitol-1-phosphate/altronate dehydrogenase
MAKITPSRISGQKILDELRLASKKGDRAALSLALDQMRTLAHSPKYWEKYLTLLRNPLARLIDLVVIKQGERIAHQKGWKLPKAVARPERPRKPKKGEKARATRARAVAGSAAQISLFE